MKEKEMSEGYQAIIFFMLIIPSVLWSGFVFSLLWGWFIVPFGVSQISILHSYGIMIMLNYAKATIEENRKMSKIIISMIVTPAITLLFGYIVQSFM